jgi:hypothetical protein
MYGEHMVNQQKCGALNGGEVLVYPFQIFFEVKNLPIVRSMMGNERDGFGSLFYRAWPSDRKHI